MVTRFYVLALFASLFTAACGSTPMSPSSVGTALVSTTDQLSAQPTDSKVTIKVVDSVSGQPVVQAHVVLADSGSNTYSQGDTNVRGVVDDLSIPRSTQDYWAYVTATSGYCLQGFPLINANGADHETLQLVPNASCNVP